jgi:hypothetical protein
MTMGRKLGCTTNAWDGGMQWYGTISGDHWWLTNHLVQGQIGTLDVPGFGSAESVVTHCCKRFLLPKKADPEACFPFGLPEILWLSYGLIFADP